MKVWYVMKNKKNRDAQVPTEYQIFMVYGIALIIVVGITIIMFKAGIFNTISEEGDCFPQMGFLCGNPELNQNGMLNITFGVIGSDIIITATKCTTTSVLPNNFTTVDIGMPSGHTTTLSFKCPIVSDRIGAPFSGYLWITYNTQGGPSQNIMLAKVDARVENE
jgi:hypothetical protein